MPDLVIPLEGGLNLQDDPTQCPPGTLRDCLNFEVTQQAGYSLRGGWQFYDGTIMGTELQDFLYLYITSGWNSVNAIYGEQITLTVGGVSVLVICIGFSNLGGGKAILAFINTIGGPSYATLSQLSLTAAAGALSGFSLAATTVIQQAGYYGSNSDPYVGGANGLRGTSYENILQTVIATSQVTQILTVPGNQNSSPDASFLLADNTYCVHDCTVFNFNNGTDSSTRLLEGHVIKAVGGGTTYGTVLSFVTTGGEWHAGTASGYVVVYDIPLSTFFPADGTQMNVYTADGVTLIGNIFKYVQAGSLAAYPATSRALLYKTTDQTVGRTVASTGWSRVALTRELQYSQAYAGQIAGIGFGPTGGAPFSIYEYSRQGLTTVLSQLTPINSGPVAGTPGFYGCTNAVQFSTLWTNLNNIKVDDGTYATSTVPIPALVYNNLFQAQGVSFADVPLNAALVGITAQIHWKTTTANNTLQDYEIKLIKPDGTMTVSKASNTFATTSATYFTYGGPNDMWGYGWKQSDITNANFGLYVNIKNVNAVTSDTANIDFVGFQVTYLPPSRVVYIRNALAAAPTDVPAFIIHYTLDNNTQFASNNGVGTLTISGTGTEAAMTAAGKTRVVGAGEQIRDAPGGAGNLLGWTTSTDLPTSLPCGAALNTNASRWEWITYNFYGDPAFQMAFGANGVEFGVGFDGTNLVRIRTGRRNDLDNPRHVFGYASNLHLGFNSGDTIVTAPGRPLTVAGLQLSQSYNIGQPVTGYSDLAGQVLAVFGTRKVFGLQGTDPTNYTTTTLSPALGAFEYTVVNVEGEVLWTSFRGVETMQTTNAYGEFSTVPLSQASTPWLQPRLQGDGRIALLNTRPVYALAVRNKRQYRLFFADGYTYSLTKFGPQGVPMGMIGKYNNGSAAILARHVFQGIKSDGKEVLYACWDTIAAVGTYTGNPRVAKLDVGAFDGGSVTLKGFFELNPVYPYQQNRNLTPEHQAQYDNLSFFAAALTGAPAGVGNMNVWSMAGDDIPATGVFGNYQGFPTTATAAVLPFNQIQLQLFLPLPVLSSRCTLAAYGRMIRLRFETNLVPLLRATKVQVTYDSAMQEKT